MDPLADYGALNGLARSRVSTRLLADHWEDLLRMAGSLATGAVRASEVLRVLQGGGRPTTLGRALAEYGRIAKTLHLLAFVDADESYRRQIGAQLSLQESRHRLARKVFHGQRGELRQRYREGQEDQLGVLGLVVNAIVLCYLGRRWPGCAPPASRSQTPTWRGCHRSATPTSTCSAATTSRPAHRLAVCGRSAILTSPTTNPTSSRTRW